MARFITVTVRCDWGDCRETGEEGDGTVVEKTLSIDGKQARAFLLCKEHIDAFENVVLPLMAAGIKVDQAPSTKRLKTSTTNGNDNGAVVEDPIDPKNICRVPGCGRPMKNRAGMAQHVIRAHGFESLAEYAAQYPDSTID